MCNLIKTIVMIFDKFNREPVHQLDWSTPRSSSKNIPIGLPFNIDLYLVSHPIITLTDISKFTGDTAS